jgi:alpha-ketoglutarate-dependent taurine dioxygenase
MEDRRLIPTACGAGAEVRGVDLASAPPASTVDTLKRALAEYGVLHFRGKALDEAQQLRFTRCFGETRGHPLPGIGGRSPREDSNRQVFYLTHGLEPDGGAERSLGDGELGWHSDLQYMSEPQVYSLLWSRRSTRCCSRWRSRMRVERRSTAT